MKTGEDEIRLTEVLAAYFSVPLFVSSVYGMNIELPLQDKWYAFWLFVAVCVVWIVIVTVVGNEMHRNTRSTAPFVRPFVRPLVPHRGRARWG